MILTYTGDGKITPLRSFCPVNRDTSQGARSWVPQSEMNARKRTNLINIVTTLEAHHGFDERTGDFRSIEQSMHSPFRC
jgi:hypothetical protein